MSFEQDYAEWKGWQHAVLDADAAEVFTKECVGAGIRKGARILEVGFGAGLFLDWARQSGYDVCGLDTNSEAVCIAAAKGHRVKCETLVDHAEFGYDAIVAFDVLEHLTRPQLEAFGAAVASKLSHAGVLLARFPNGASPWGRHYQHSDPTHRGALTPTLLKTLLRPMGLSPAGAWNSARPSGQGLPRRAVRKLRALLRSGINSATSWAYFGRVIPFDPNVTVAFRRD